MQPRDLIAKIRAKVGKTGGWDKPGSWAVKIGLTRAQVDQWHTRGDIPKGWKVALEQQFNRGRK